METIENYSADFNEILSAINSFNYLRISANKISKIIEYGLQVFMKIPNAIRASYFQLNSENYDLELKLTLPNNQHDAITMKNHIQLIDEGNIGETIASMKLSFFSLNDHEFIYVVPLLCNSEIIGIIEVFATVDAQHLPSYDNMEISTVNLITIFANYFASSVKEFILKEQNQYNKELVDQLVALRTIEISKKQQETISTLETLKLNLSMSIPHEIRTPINQISGLVGLLNTYVKLLPATEETEEINEIVTELETSTDRLHRLLENYLYFANLNIIAASIDALQEFSQGITKNIKSIISEYSNIIAYKHNRAADLKINLVDGIIKIPEKYLIKIIEELMDNAMKYSEVNTEITLTSISDNDFYHIIVKNIGRGMTEEQIARIGAYMQFDRDKYEQQGSGLGLAIVSRIMDLCHGDIEINSEIDKFNKVSIKIPHAKNDI